MILVVGNRYLVDANYNSGGEVILLRQGNYFCTVQDPETGGVWDVMKNRLSSIGKGDNNGC